MTLTTRKMSGRHEADLVDRLGGRLTKGSGSTWADQTDGKQEADSGYYVFAWDGKSTLGKSIGVTREMWTKLKEQAQYRLPAIPLRWYRDERLSRVDLDLVAIELETFAQLLEDANTYREIKEAGCLTGSHRYRPLIDMDDPNPPRLGIGPSSDCLVCGASIYDQPGDGA